MDQAGSLYSGKTLSTYDGLLNKRSNIKKTGIRVSEKNPVGFLMTVLIAAVLLSLLTRFGNAANKHVVTRDANVSQPVLIFIKQSPTHITPDRRALRDSLVQKPLFLERIGNAHIFSVSLPWIEQSGFCRNEDETRFSTSPHTQNETPVPLQDEAVHDFFSRRMSLMQHHDSIYWLVLPIAMEPNGLKVSAPPERSTEKQVRKDSAVQILINPGMELDALYFRMFSDSIEMNGGERLFAEHMIFTFFKQRLSRGSTAFQLDSHPVELMADASYPAVYPSVRLYLLPGFMERFLNRWSLVRRYLSRFFKEQDVRKYKDDLLQRLDLVGAVENAYLNLLARLAMREGRFVSLGRLNDQIVEIDGQVFANKMNRILQTEQYEFYCISGDSLKTDIPAEANMHFIKEDEELQK